VCQALRMSKTVSVADMVTAKGKAQTFDRQKSAPSLERTKTPE
jgi:hypothetical protein